MYKHSFCMWDFFSCVPLVKNSDAGEEITLIKKQNLNPIKPRFFNKLQFKRNEIYPKKPILKIAFENTRD